MPAVVVSAVLVLGPVSGSRAEPLPGGAVDPTTIPKYVTPLVIPPVMNNDGMANNYFFHFASGTLQGRPGVACMMAPLYVPNGVTIYRFRANIVDNSTADDFSLWLYRVNNYDGSTNVMATISTTGLHDTTIWNLVDYTIDYATVDCPSYSYYVCTCMYDGHMLYNARVYYY